MLAVGVEGGAGEISTPHPHWLASCTSNIPKCSMRFESTVLSKVAQPLHFVLRVLSTEADLGLLAERTGLKN